MGGFTVTCNKCGNSTVFNEDLDNRYTEGAIYISGSTMFDANIECPNCDESVFEI